MDVTRSSWPLKNKCRGLNTFFTQCCCAFLFMLVLGEGTLNFSQIPTYILTTSATDGSITLNPAGGTYYEGTVVTVMAVPKDRKSVV